MSDVCKNEYCQEPVAALGKCQSCYSYESIVGAPRPPSLIIWPGKGHPLATTSDVVAMTGMSYRMIDYAIRTFDLSTTVEGKGSGHQRGWSVYDVTNLLVMYVQQKAKTIKLSIPIDGIEFVIDSDRVKEWVMDNWPDDADYWWDGSLPEPSATV